MSTKHSTTFVRLLGLVALGATLAMAFSKSEQALQSVVDVRAALLVFVAPVLLLIVFGKGGTEWRQLLKRVRELRAVDEPSLMRELSASTDAATGSFASAHMLRLSETHSDSFVRFAAQLQLSRFESREYAQLLARRIEAEDEAWREATVGLGFLAKMAPYFGMLATVIGMVSLLQNLTDFSKISADMALAMKGTLYGLVSFTLVYAPLQKFVNGYKARVLKRNESVARWFVRVAEREEAAYIREELRSHSFGHSSMAALPSASSNTPLAEGGTTR